MRFHFWLVLIFCIPHRAWAESADNEANARLQTGITFGQQGKWESARIAFLQAYGLVPSVNVLWNLAFAELKSGQPLDALEHFKMYENTPKAEPSKIAALPALRERAYREIGRLKIEAPALALVSVDGVETAWSEPLDVQPGAHILAVHMGAQKEERTVTVTAGEVLDVSFSFTVETPPAPSGPSIAEQPPRPTTATTRYWVAGGLSVGAVAAASLGLGFGLTANAERRSLENHLATLGPSCKPAGPTCAVWMDEASSQPDHVNLARGFLIGSAALASAAVVTFFVWPHANPVVVVVPNHLGADLAFSTQF